MRNNGVFDTTCLSDITPLHPQRDGFLLGLVRFKKPSLFLHLGKTQKDIFRGWLLVPYEVDSLFKHVSEKHRAAVNTHFQTPQQSTSPGMQPLEATLAPSHTTMIFTFFEQ